MEERLLRAVDAIHVATVFEDCVDQLSILGRIMPNSFEFRPDAQELVRNEIDALVDGQQRLETKFQSAVETKTALHSKTKNSAKLRAAEQGVSAVGGDLKNSTHVFGRSLRQNPLTGDNTSKIQDDRCRKSPPSRQTPEARVPSTCYSRYTPSYSLIPFEGASAARVKTVLRSKVSAAVSKAKKSRDNEK